MALRHYGIYVIYSITALRHLQFMAFNYSYGTTCRNCNYNFDSNYNYIKKTYRFQDQDRTRIDLTIPDHVADVTIILEAIIRSNMLTSFGIKLRCMISILLREE